MDVKWHTTWPLYTQITLVFMEQPHYQHWMRQTLLWKKTGNTPSSIYMLFWQTCLYVHVDHCIVYHCILLQDMIWLELFWFQLGRVSVNMLTYLLRATIASFIGISVLSMMLSQVMLFDQVQDLHSNIPHMSHHQNIHFNHVKGNYKA